MKAFLGKLAAIGLCVCGVALTPTPAFAAASTGDGLSKEPITASARSTAKDAISSGVQNAGGDSDGADISGAVGRIVNVMFFILGAVSVVMIIIGGIRYTTSNGDSNAVTSAKNTVLYAVVGLVIAILSYAIVRFILDAF